MIAHQTLHDAHRQVLPQSFAYVSACARTSLLELHMRICQD